MTENPVFWKGIKNPLLWKIRMPANPSSNGCVHSHSENSQTKRFLRLRNTSCFVTPYY